MTLPGTVRKLGPGTLTIGAVGTALDFSGRCLKAAVTWKVDQSDDSKRLSGDTIAGERTYTATLEATVDQDDLTTGDLTDYSWSNKGSEVPFTYTPYPAPEGGTARAITGQLVIDPLDVGGDVDKKNTTDLKWACVGEPELVDDLA